jgi:serine/threonine-protein kinase
MTPETIAHYRITALIGSGGMGEVYRARDTKLGRDVAIKILPPAFASDANRMARFEREARVLASLNHPNIAHIYGVEDRALVMELVEGQSPKGPMPFDEAWKIALQIADALEYAHDKGVVHRDLKPANVKVTPDGVVKLLDFGLAKAYSDSPDAAGNDPEHSPTLTLGATVAGTIIGTAAYMSPEQARGKPVDKRADIWSWGVVLYELLTGERMFQGEDAADTLAAVIHKQPDLEKAPPQVRLLLRRCLEKDPKKRLRDISVAKELLDEKPQATAPYRTPLPWIAAAALFATIAAVSGWIAWRPTRPIDHPLVRLDVDLGADVTLTPTNVVGDRVILSPDGSRLVYSATIGGGTRRLFTRRLDQPKATELPGTEGAAGPFFSPDSQWVGFFKPGKLNKISVQGGAVVPLAEFMTEVAGATWGEDGDIVMSDVQGKGLLRIPAGGGSATVLEPLAKEEAALPWPQVLPGGKAFLVTSARPGGFTTQVLTLADHRRKTVLHGASSAHYVPVSAREGYLIYTKKATMFAVPFDLDKLETRGNEVPVLNDVGYATSPIEWGQFAYSPSGTLVYRTGVGSTNDAISTIQWVDADGKREPLLSKPGVYSYPAFSPDGTRLAIDVADASSQNIWVHDLQRNRSIQLTFGGVNRIPAWTPDGRYLVFSYGAKGLRWTRADGSGEPQPLLQGDAILIPYSFGPDRRLAYDDSTGVRQIWTVPLQENDGGLKPGESEQFRKDRSTDLLPVFSRDGRWLAHESNASGPFEVFVRPFPPPASGQDRYWQISNTGAGAPFKFAWPRDGHELYYQSGDQIMAAGYAVEGNTFVPGNTRVWIPKLGGVYWDVTPDGKRVAVVTPLAGAAAPDHTVVFLQNFVDYLKRQVPLNK